MDHNSINGTSGTSGPHEKMDNNTEKKSPFSITEPIAIVGISCKFAGTASNVEGLWETLSAGRDNWSPIPKSRFDIDSLYHPDQQRTDRLHVKGGYFLTEDLDAFDAPFFNLAAEAASAMDPQLRLLLEGVYEAIESAGIPLEKLSHSNTSVFSASFSRDYNDMLMKDPNALPTTLVTGNGPAMLANRISHFYNLRGPSATVDTGCSGGLVALHLGIQTIRNRESDIAIIGASNAILNPDFFVAISNLGLLHPDGRCYSMDHRWGGYGRGEGVAVLVLKRLSAALSDGDHIHAVIRESAINQDGKTGTITSPSMEAQHRLIEECYRRANLDISSTGYVEAHLTGTSGDAIEAEALARTFGKSRQPGDAVIVGSIKSNIGHTEPVSGLASIIKAALVLRHQLIPANATFEKPNPNIPLEDWNLEVPTTLTPWPSGKPLRVSVNNFGYGGTNAHVILEAPPNSKIGHPGVVMDASSKKAASEPKALNGCGLNFVSEPQSFVYVVSAKDETGTIEMSRKLSRHLRKATENYRHPQPSTSSLAYTLAERRSRFPWVSALRARSLEELIERLEDPYRRPIRGSSLHPRIGFVFNGQGSQWHAMGRELLNTYAAFDSAARHAEVILREYGAVWSLREELQRDAKSTRVHEVELSQPLSVAVQLCLVDLLKSWNVTPSAVVSHSSGEIAAAYAAGILTFKEALGVVYHRGRLAYKYQQQLNQQGGMLAVGASVEEAEEYIKDLSSQERVVVACVNSPASITVSGDLDALDELAVRLKEDGIFVRKLKVPLAYHSHHMEPMTAEYESCIVKVLGTRSNGQVRCRYASPVTGGIVSSCETFGPKHWVRNLTSPVLFSKALGEMVFGQLQSENSNWTSEISAQTAQVSILLEVGAHNTLAGPVRQTLGALNLPYLSCLRRSVNAGDTMQDVACELVARGYPILLGEVNKSISSTLHQPVYLHDLPSYHWNHQLRYNMEPRVSNEHRFPRFVPHELLGRALPGTNPLNPQWRNYLRVRDVSWLAQHQLESTVVLPGAAYVSMAIEAIRMLKQSRMKDMAGLHYRLRDVEFINTLIIPSASNSPEKGVETHFSLRTCNNKELDHEDWYEFEMWSSTNSSYVQHCKGGISAFFDSSEPDNAAIHLFRSLDSHSLSEKRFLVSPESVYQTLRKSGFDHGSSFQNLVSSHVDRELSSTNFAVAAVAFEGFDKYVIHPTTLDSIFQSCYASLPGVHTYGAMLIPRSIDKMYIAQQLGSFAGQKLSARLELVNSGLGGAIFKGIVIPAEDGSQNGNHDRDGTGNQTNAVQLQGFRLQRLEQVANIDTGYRSETRVHAKNRWELDVLHAMPSDIKEKMKIRLSKTERESSENVREASYHLIVNALDQLEHVNSNLWNWHSKRFYNWMRTIVQSAEQGTLAVGSKQWSERSDDFVQKLLKEVAAHNASGELVHRVGQHLAEIVQGQIAPLELMMEGGLLNRYYQELPQLVNGSYKHLRQVVEIYAVKEPGARVLEIGGGTGGATSIVLEAFAARSGRGVKNSLLEHYDFTDISSGFFTAAKTKFANWDDIMSYKRLDIERPPLEQGFTTQYYDLIIASHVLHATNSLKRTLAHVKQLLRPGGKLILLEGTQDALDVQLVFGTVETWWLSEEPERQMSPYVNLKIWDDSLRAVGFSGIDFEIGDCEDPEVQFTSTIVTTAENPLPQHPLSTSIITLCSNSQPWLNQLATVVQQVTGSAATVTNFELAEGIENQVVILNLDEDQPFLDSMDSDMFVRLRRILLQSQGVLWLSPEGADTVNDPLFAQSTGLLRTLRREDSSKRYARLACDSLLNPSTTDIDIIAYVFKQTFDYSLSTDARMDWEYAIKSSKLHVPRIYPDLEQDRVSGGGKTLPQTHEFQQTDKLLIWQPASAGAIDTEMIFAEQSDVAENLPNGMIEIEAKAFGLNFTDVTSVSSSTEEAVSITHESSGIVKRLGPGTEQSGLRIGDRVCGIFQNHFSNYGRAFWSTVATIPDWMSWEEAACIPYAFIAAWICLHDIARLKKHERILINSAAGDVGQAALNIASHIEAEVFVTCDTNDERQLLEKTYKVSPDHILSSRDVSFAAEIMSKTASDGVDVVLNPLTGPSLKASWECTSRFGRFVQIRKADVDGPKNLDLSPFGRGVSMTGFNLTSYCEFKGEVVYQALSKSIEMLQNKNIRLVEPITTFSLANARMGISQVRDGAYMGKLVLAPQTGEKVKMIPLEPLPLSLEKPNTTYLLVGGLGGIGLATAHWMMEKGAKSLLIVSRNATSSPNLELLVQRGRTSGCDVHVRNCDIADEEAVHQLLTEVKRCLPPIRGIIQAAAILDDTIFERMTYQQWQKAIGPKVTGTWVLHKHLQNLRFFIITSSSTGILGNVSQANYTAGGTFQDALARYRTKHGLPAVTIDLGPIEGVGYIAKEGEVMQKRVEKALGMKSLPIAHVLRLFEDIIRNPWRRHADDSQIITCVTGYRNLVDDPSVKNDKRFGTLRLGDAGDVALSTKAPNPSTTYMDKLILKLSEYSLSKSGEAIGVAKDLLIAKVADLFDLSVQDIDPEVPLTHHGLDSLVAVEFKNWLNGVVLAKVSTFEILQSQSLLGLARLVVERRELVC